MWPAKSVKCGGQEYTVRSLAARVDEPCHLSAVGTWLVSSLCLSFLTCKKEKWGVVAIVLISHRWNENEIT